MLSSILYILVLFFSLEWPFVRIWIFFSSFGFAYAFRGYEAPQGHSVVMDDLRRRCHTSPRVLLALAIILLYDFNFADS